MKIGKARSKHIVDEEGTPYKIHIEGYIAEHDSKTDEWTVRKNKMED